jgi:hypothetical protein
MSESCRPDLSNTYFIREGKLQYMIQTVNVHSTTLFADSVSTSSFDTDSVYVKYYGLEDR